MVKDTRTASGAGVIRALNQPRLLAVKASKDGLPVALKLRGRWVEVESVVDHWKIDDEWWRERPTCRRYYECMVDQGLKVVVFQDLVGGGWFQQRV